MNTSKVGSGHGPEDQKTGSPQSPGAFFPSHSDADGHLEAHSAHPGPPGSLTGALPLWHQTWALQASARLITVPHVSSWPRPASPPAAMGTAPEAWDQLPVPLLCPALLFPPHKVPLDPPQWGPKHLGHTGISGAKEMRKQTSVAERAALCFYKIMYLCTYYSSN